MKILYVLPSGNASYGGPVQVVQSYIKECKKKGVDAAIFPKYSVSRTVYLFPFYKGFKLTYFPGLKELFMTLRSSIMKADLVHINGLWSAPTVIASYFSKKLHIPYIISPHGMLSEWGFKQNNLGKRTLLFIAEKENLRKASAVHLFCDEELEYFEKFGINTSIFILPNGVDLAHFNDLPPKNVLEQKYPELKNKKIALFLGRIHPKKGFDVLIPSLANARHKVPNLHLIIAGPDEQNYKKEVSLLISKYSVEKSVTFTGFADGDLKKMLLGGADFFILPSYQEGDSVAIKEAMAAGLPVIITPYCHFSEVKWSKAGLVVDTQIEEISNAIIQFCRDANMRVEMGKNARALIEQKYTWDRISGKLIEIYEDILNNKFTSDCWRINQ